MKKYIVYPDDELLHLLSKDDEKAFTAIYNRYWKMIYAIGYSRLKDEQLAEDVLHDVFASLWTNRSKITIISLPNYLATASRYLVFAAIRKHVHQQKYLQSETEIPVINIEDDLIYKQLAHFMSKEVELLPERCRLVFRCREKGMSNRQIAEEMNITLKTVENQVNKALHHLRFSMKKILSIFV